MKRHDDTDGQSAPWDPVVGLRVGLFAGGVLGGLIAVVTGVTHVAVVASTAVLGGFVGWWSQRRNR